MKGHVFCPRSHGQELASQGFGSTAEDTSAKTVLEVCKRMEKAEWMKQKIPGTVGPWPVMHALKQSPPGRGKPLTLKFSLMYDQP